MKGNADSKIQKTLNCLQNSPRIFLTSVKLTSKLIWSIPMFVIRLLNLTSSPLAKCLERVSLFFLLERNINLVAYSMAFRENKNKNMAPFWNFFGKTRLVLSFVDRTYNYQIYQFSILSFSISNVKRYEWTGTEEGKSKVKNHISWCVIESGSSFYGIYYFKGDFCSC